MKRKTSIAALLLGFLILPRETHAIPPPDVITTIGSSFAQIASLFVVIASVGISFVIRYLKQIQASVKKKPAQAALVAMVLAALIGGSVYGMTKFAWTSEEESEETYEEEVSRKLREAIDERDITNDPEEFSAFYEAYKELPLTVSNEEFALTPLDAFVLDAREDEEYEIGFYKGSVHIRFADILAGAWEELPSDRVVYVMCWSGLRGSEVAAFLREKGIVAQALEGGANGWVESGGAWEGEIAFSHVYGDERYRITFTTDEVRALVSTGAVLIDARTEVDEIAQLPESIQISSIYTPTTELDLLLDQVAPGTRIITVCDDFVSCFDAKIVGIKLEKKGAIFLGRFSSPWEY